MRITEITRGKIKDFLLSKINDDCAKSTVSHFKDCISGVLNKALDDEIIPANPALRLGKILHRKDIKASVDPLTVKELNLLLKTVLKKYREHYPLFLLLSRTGICFYQ